MSKSPITKIIIIIIIALLVPVFTYTVFQFQQSNKNEKLIESIYDRQLSSILFSVNQYCWDIFISWSAELSTQAESYTRQSYGRLKSGLFNFYHSQTVVTGSFVRFSPQNIVYSIEDESITLRTMAQRSEFYKKLNSLLESDSTKIKRSIIQAEKGYIRPVSFLWENNPGKRVSLLIFPIPKNSYSGDNTILTGIFIDEIAYIYEIIARKFGSMNDGNFVFAVKANDEILFSTEEEIEEGNFEKKRKSMDFARP